MHQFLDKSPFKSISHQKKSPLDPGVVSTQHLLMRHWRTTKDEKGLGLGGPSQVPQREKELYCKQRARSQVESRSSATSLSTTLTGIPSGTTKCRSHPEKHAEDSLCFPVSRLTCFIEVY